MSNFLVDTLGLPKPRPFDPCMVVQTSNGVSLDSIATEDDEIIVEHCAFLISEAGFYGIRQLRPHPAVLELNQVSAVTEGADAQATVSVRLAEQGLVASASAYVHALNKLEVRRAKATGAAA